MRSSSTSSRSRSRIFDEWLLDPEAEPIVFERLAVASDADRGFIILTVGDRTGSTVGPMVMWLYDLDGRRRAGPYPALDDWFAPHPRIQLFADDEGGAFVVSSASGGALYQHIDREGRPAFGARVRYCGGVWDGEPGVEFVHPRP